MSLIKYPYTDLHSINLDWIIEEVKKCYSPENPPDMAVLSVNGMTGDVTLYTDPAAVFPEIEGTTWSLGRTAAGTLVGIKFNKTLPLQRMNGNSLFNIYDEGNPPPYPVTSVNGRTGAVSVQEAFFSLTGDTITFITDSPDHSWSLDRATLDGSISLRLDTTNDTPSAYLEYVSDDETIHRTIKLLTPDDIPSSSGVVSVNGKAGIVTLTGDDIAQEEGSAVTVASALNTLGDNVENITDKIGSTSMGTQATTVTGAIREHSTAIGNANTNITNINTKLGNVGSTPVQDQIDSLNSNLTSLNTPEDKQITNTASYFAERTAFKARRVGHSVNIYSYVQITTAIPSGTEFADTHFPMAEGIFLMMGGDGANPRIVRCTAGKLLSDSAIPTGYYYVVGSALAPVIAN